MCPATGYHELRQCFGSSMKLLPASHHMKSFFAGRGREQDTQQENSNRKKAVTQYTFYNSGGFNEDSQRYFYSPTQWHISQKENKRVSCIA
jgi:uncharacterized membrane-anchored protein YhcB (DUF1043 family)